MRYTLIPYIVEQSRKAIASGAPLLQALIFHHPEDKLCWHIDDEYYFGNDFLVAPVMNSENRRDVYLPEGKWVNFFTGEALGRRTLAEESGCPSGRNARICTSGSDHPRLSG